MGFWAPIVERYDLDIRLVNDTLDPTLPFMSVDRDRKARMDCSSPYAMAPLVGLKDRFDIAFGNHPRRGPARQRGAWRRPISLPIVPTGVRMLPSARPS